MEDVPESNRTLIGPNSSDLSWIYSDSPDTLQMKFFTTFKGSAETAGCGGDCFCWAVFGKSTS